MLLKLKPFKFYYILDLVVDTGPFAITYLPINFSCLFFASLRPLFTKFIWQANLFECLNQHCVVPKLQHALICLNSTFLLCTDPCFPLAINNRMYPYCNTFNMIYVPHCAYYLYCGLEKKNCIQQKKNLVIHSFLVTLLWL